MATTFSVDDLISTQYTRAVAQTLINVASFASGITTPNAQGGEDTIYRFVGGARADLPTTLRIGNYPPSKPGQSVNSSAKLRTTILKTDGAGVETMLPFEVVVAISDGSLGQLSRTDVAKLACVALSAIVRGTAYNNTALSVNALDAIARGATDVLPLMPNPLNA